MLFLCSFGGRLVPPARTVGSLIGLLCGGWSRPFLVVGLCGLRFVVVCYFIVAYADVMGLILVRLGFRRCRLRLRRGLRLALTSPSSSLPTSPLFP